MADKRIEKQLKEWEEYSAKIETLLNEIPKGGDRSAKSKLKFHLGIAWEQTGVIEEGLEQQRRALEDE